MKILATIFPSSGPTKAQGAAADMKRSMIKNIKDTFLGCQDVNLYYVFFWLKFWRIKTNAMTMSK